tara:strand:- start:222 stop:611 length:390 start_codon:yes stop_codon:yes gene_type:complete
MEWQRKLEAAERHLIDGKHEAAREVLDRLPLEEKVTLPVLVLQLRILTAMEDWTEGERYIADLRHEEEREIRRTVARFYLARARWFTRLGLVEEANQDYWENAPHAWYWITKEYEFDDFKFIFRERFEE